MITSVSFVAVVFWAIDAMGIAIEASHETGDSLSMDKALLTIL